MMRFDRSRRVTPVSGHGPRVVRMIVVTVAAATVVLRRVGARRGRRPAAGSHGHGQRGDLLGRPVGRGRAAAPAAVVVEVDPPLAPGPGGRHVHAARPAPSRRIRARPVLGGCWLLESSGRSARTRTKTEKTENKIRSRLCYRCTIITVIVVTVIIIIVVIIGGVVAK